MNRRGKRLTLGVMAVGFAVVLGLAIAHWRAIVDHVEVWYFQLTTETEVIEPGPVTARLKVEIHGSEAYSCEIGELLSILKLPVIIEPRYKPRRVWWPIDNPSPLEMRTQPDLVSRILRVNRIRVLEQRFPQRAYVVIRDQGATR